MIEYTYGGTHDILLSNITYWDRTFKILDIGCGSGKFIADLHNAGFKNVHGCDGFLEPELPGFNNFKKCTFDKKLPYKDNTFDVLFLSEVIEHIDNPNFLLSESHRILKPTGILILNTPNIYTLIGRLVFLFTGNFIGFLEVDAKFEKFPGHITPFSLKHTMRIFKDKFSIHQEFYSDFIVPKIGWHIKWRNKWFGNTLFAKLKKL